MSGTHSILAPSGSSRWLRCVGALYLSRGVVEPDKEHRQQAMKDLKREIAK